METLDCYTGIVKPSSSCVISSCCVPILGNLEREVVKTTTPGDELELVCIHRVLASLSLTNAHLTGEFLPAFKAINIFTSSKYITRLLAKKKVDVGEMGHRIATDLSRVLVDGLHGKPVSILYIPKSKNFAYKRYADIPFKQLVGGMVNASSNR